MLQESISFLRHNMREIVETMDSNLTFSMLKLLECFFKPFIPKEVRTSQELVSVTVALIGL